MTLGESLLTELDVCEKIKSITWDYASRQRLRAIDSAELLADFLTSHGLRKVRVSDDPVQVAHNIRAAWAAEGRRHSITRALIDFVLAVVLIVTGFRTFDPSSQTAEDGLSSLALLLASLAVGASFVFFGIWHLKLVHECRRLEREGTMSHKKLSARE